MLLIVRRLLTFCTAFYGSRQTCRVGFEGGNFISLTHVSSLKIGPGVYHDYLFTFFFPLSILWFFTQTYRIRISTCVSQRFGFCKHSHNPNVVRPALVLWTSLEVSSVHRGYKTRPTFCVCVWLIIGDFEGLQISPLSLGWFLKYIWQWTRPFKLHQIKRFFFFLLLYLRCKWFIQDNLVRTGEKGEGKKVPDVHDGARGHHLPEGMGTFWYILHNPTKGWALSKTNSLSSFK